MTPFIPGGGADFFAGPAHPGLGNLPQREVIHIVFTTKLATLLERYLPHDEEAGQGLAEYALILALIAIVSIIALLYLGSQISDKLSVIGDNL
jgi:pilus assembly protein Flp/PilA